MDAERCVSCGEIIPEGAQVCFSCMTQDAIPLEDDIPRMNPNECFKCGTKKPFVTISMHEPLMGAKYRRLSRKYGLVVPLCLPGCHDLVQREPSQEYNRMLQKIMQRKFMRDYPHLDFMKIFGRNYL